MQKDNGAPITVEVKLLGMFGAEFLSESQMLELHEGDSAVDAVDSLLSSGAIDKTIHKQIRKLKPPYFVVLNDVKQEKKPKTIKLTDGDVLSIMQVMTGG